MELSERFIQQLESEGFARVYDDSDPAGTTYPPHEHQGKVTLMITDGSITFTIAGKTTEYEAGDRIDIPPQTEHSCEVGPEGLIYVVAEEIVGDA
ncbi:cupin domain-containing protein [Candidatus Pacebacteria bacterium]|nr:cupin domain-containing protein [Candidatus Paceibacterota bacterium]